MDSSRATALRSLRVLCDRCGDIEKKKRSKSFDLHTLSPSAFGRVVRRTTTSPSLFSVAIKVRAKEVYLLYRTIATKRNEVHLKEGFGVDCKYNRLKPALQARIPGSAFV